MCVNDDGARQINVMLIFMISVFHWRVEISDDVFGSDAVDGSAFFDSLKLLSAVCIVLYYIEFVL